MLYRRYPNRSLFDELDRMQREMDQVMRTAYSGRRTASPGFPAMNMWSSEDGVVVTAEIPGVMADEIDISVVGEALTIRGERKQEEQQPGKFQYHRQERGFGKFTRTVELPYPVDVEEVQANLMNGILSVRLPRAEADRPRKISVGQMNNGS